MSWDFFANLFGEKETADQYGNHDVSGIGTALQNWWYSNTGQGHLTSQYQHEENLANTAYQRAAKDMAAAGLSKFGGVNPASSPSPKSAQGLLASAMAGQQLKSQILSNQTDKWNLKKAKEWGVPTSAVGDFAKYDAVSKFLFGKGIHDIVGEDGLLGLLKGWFGGNGGVSSNVVTGAATDAVQAVETNGEAVPSSPLVPVYQSIFGSSNVFKPAPFNFPKYVVTNDQGKLNVHSFDETKDFEFPSLQGAVKAAVDQSNAFNPFDGYDTSIGKEVNKFMIQTLNDDNMDTAHVESLARIISKMNGVSYESVLQLCYNWIDANLSNVEWVYHFDK